MMIISNMEKKILPRKVTLKRLLRAMAFGQQITGQAEPQTKNPGHSGRGSGKFMKELLVIEGFCSAHDFQNFISDGSLTRLVVV